MSKILLVKPNRNYWFPLGYAYLVAAWKHADIAFDFIDLDKDSINLIDKYLSRHNYTAICTGGMIASYTSIRRILTKTREILPTLPRIVGGPITTNLPLRYIFDDIKADFAVIGEGEESSVELIAHIARHGTLPCPMIRGVAWKDHRNPQGFASSPPRPKPDLDILPEPDYSFWDFSWHKTNGQASIPWGLMPVLTGRGCVGNCSFCSPPAGAYRSRSPQSVVAEIRHAAEQFEARQIYFADEMFFHDPVKIEEFCNLYKKAGIPFTWSCNMRIDGPLESLSLMREHGCTNVYFGFESVNDRVLAAMKKRTTHAMQLRAISSAEHAGVYWQALWMVGNYSETLEEMRQSFAFFRKHHQTCPALLITYPGTLNYARARKMGLLKEELSYIETLGDSFIGPVFQRFTKFIHGDLPYLNISGMGQDKFFKAFLTEVSLLVQAMEIIQPRAVTKQTESRVIEGLCPHCGNLVSLTLLPGQPFNIHSTRCPHCNPSWLHASPLKLDFFRQHISESELFLLRSKKHIVILDHDENTAFFFVMKNHLELHSEQITGFIRTPGFNTRHIFYYYVYDIHNLPPETDCVLIVATTENTIILEQQLRSTLDSQILLLDFSK